MTVLAERLRERVPTDNPLALVESATVASAIQPDGTVLMHVIRPGVGRGRGRHYYPPEMLRENAHVFTGARMFLNHETDEQKKARGHLPRPVEQVAGRIVEAWWDESVPANDRFMAGAVVARVKPRRVVKEIIEDDPDLLEVSINALATGKHVGRHPDGKSGPIVEGIRASPLTVDFIAGEGGAGGRILQESALDEEEALLESLSDDEFKDYLRENRPELLTTLGTVPGNRPAKGEREVPDMLTPEEARTALTEALATEEGKAALLPVLQEALTEMALPKMEFDMDALKSVVESAIAEQADLVTIGARAEAQRRDEVRALAARASSLIEASKLHPKLKEKLAADYSLTEAGDASVKLDVKPDFDEKGEVVKTAFAKLEESLSAEITDALDLQGALGTRTRVTGQGASGKTPTTLAALREAREGGNVDADGKPIPKPAVKSTGSPLTDALLESAGVPTEKLDSIWAPAQA
jgi:hypothetical protein